MRNLLVYSFYLCTVLFIIYELFKLGGLNMTTILKDLEKKSEAEKEDNETRKLSDPLSEPKMENQLTLGIFAIVFLGWGLFYAIWSVLGLFTSQWIFFLVLLLLSLIHLALNKLFPKYATLFLRVDAFITIILLVFMIINRFHTHWI